MLEMSRIAQDTSAPPSRKARNRSCSILEQSEVTRGHLLMVEGTHPFPRAPTRRIQPRSSSSLQARAVQPIRNIRAQVGNSVDCLGSGHPGFHEPAAYDRSRPASASPAVHVDWPACSGFVAVVARIRVISGRSSGTLLSRTGTKHASSPLRARPRGFAGRRHTSQVVRFVRLDRCCGYLHRGTSSACRSPVPRRLRRGTCRRAARSISQGSCMYAWVSVAEGLALPELETSYCGATGMSESVLAGYSDSSDLVDVARTRRPGPAMLHRTRRAGLPRRPATIAS